MGNVVMFGAGKYAQNILKDMKCEQWTYDIDKIVFCDNNSNLWGKSLGDSRIVSPASIEIEKYECFVISSTYEREIRKQLVQEMGVDEKKILTFDEYAKRKYTSWVYAKKYGNEKERAEGCFDTKSVIVYTAITGDYDTLKEPEYVEENLTYVCFTNNRKLKSRIWNIEYIDNGNLDNMHLAKKVKLEPHIYCKGYETSVWVDGSMQIRDDLCKYIDIYGRNKSILCFPHYQRNCIYDEAAACLFYRKGNKEKILKQINNYYKMGYPIDAGLYAMGCIVRRHNDSFIQKLMLDWMNEIKMFSYRDQLSFPVVCWKHDFSPDICDLSINNNQFLKLWEHN